MITKIYKWAITSRCFKNADFLICGLPKTSTTWIKCVLVDYYYQTQNDSLDIASELTFEYGNIQNLEKYKNAKVKIIKTHKPKNIFHNEAKKVIYLKRDLYTNLISYYVYCISKGIVEEQINIRNFVQKFNIINWFKNFENSWLNSSDVIIDFDYIINDNYNEITLCMEKVIGGLNKNLMLECLKNNSVEKNKIKYNNSPKIRSKFNNNFNFVGQSDEKDKILKSIDEKDIIWIKKQL